MKKIKEIIIVVEFVRKKGLLIKLEIVVIYHVKIEVQLIRNVILLSRRNEVTSYQLYFTLFVFTIVTFSSKN